MLKKPCLLRKAKQNYVCIFLQVLWNGSHLAEAAPLVSSWWLCESRDEEAVHPRLRQATAPTPGPARPQLPAAFPGGGASFQCLASLSLSAVPG